MNDPIKIMKEIERSGLTDDGTPMPSHYQWHELRTAIEELQEWNQEMVKKAASGGTLEGYRDMGQKIAQLETTTEAQLARITRLHEMLWDLWAGVHYHNEDETGDLCVKCDMTEAQYENLETVLNESNEQSHARLKAGVLREAAAEKRKEAAAEKERMQPYSSINGEAEWLEERANQIEHQANKCKNPDCRDGWVFPKGVNYWHGTPDMERCPECEAKENK